MSSSTQALKEHKLEGYTVRCEVFLQLSRDENNYNSDGNNEKKGKSET